MRNVVSAMFVASWLVVGAAAQGQQPVTPGQPAQGEKPAAAAAAKAVAKVTISGCLQSAAPAAGEAAAPAAAASKFELTNAKVVSGGPVGTSGATTATRYRLEGEEKTISPHLTQQVELTGMVAPASPSASAAAAPVLRVESVKMVSAKCS